MHVQFNKKYTVTELVTEIKNSLEEIYKSIVLVGEITNFSMSSSGHFYFLVSDHHASINAVIFKTDGFRNHEVKKIKDGDKVICHGFIGVYPRKGSFQIIVKKIELIGKGDLLIQFEQLKKRLSAEGLFDMAKKKPIPPFAAKLAVITSKEGAAIQDFIKIFLRRSVWADILIFPSIVQGSEAPKSLRKSLALVREYNKYSTGKVEIVVITRGGGSLEDLWGFNDEALARDIFDFPIPVISAVGHEIDFTICDYVSDLRCETPSAAAEILTEPHVRLTESFINLRKKLLLQIKQKIFSEKNSLEEKRPQIILNSIWKKYLEFQKRLERGKITHRFYQMAGLHQKLLYIDELGSKMQNATSIILTRNITFLEKMNELLRVLNPLNVLGRGYVFLRNKSNQILTSHEQFLKLKEGEILEVQFKDGSGVVVKGG